MEALLHGSTAAWKWRHGCMEVRLHGNGGTAAWRQGVGFIEKDISLYHTAASMHNVCSCSCVTAADGSSELGGRCWQLCQQRGGLRVVRRVAKHP